MQRKKKRERESEEARRLAKGAGEQILNEFVY